MKKELWKIVLLIAVGIIPCHIEIMGCYPLIVAYFVGVYMEDFYRGGFTVFMYLWMMMWLPITQLGKYGITCLVTMVTITFAERIYKTSKKVYGAVVSSAIIVLVSIGGEALYDLTKYNNWVIAMEGVLTLGAVVLINREVGLFIPWKLTNEEIPQERQVSDWHFNDYAKAFEGLSETFTQISQKREGISTYQMQRAEKELELKLCNTCGQCSVCREDDYNFSQLMQSVWKSFMESGSVDESTRALVMEKCIHGENFIEEALQIFDKIHLNISWYNRLMENREMIAGQLDAMSYAMENCINREKCVDDRERGTGYRIKYYLHENGILAKDIHFYSNENETMRITMELKARWGNCIIAKEVLKVLTQCCKIEMIPSQRNRNFIGRERFMYEFVTKPKLMVDYGVARLIQEGQEISGDNYSVVKREDGKVMAAVSDGMGTGYEANKESEMVIELMEQFTEAGFSMGVALKLMNAAMVFGGEDGHYSTLDLCLLDSYTGILEFYKVGAHVSYLKHKTSVEVIAEETLPVGAEIAIDTTPWRNHMENGDFLVMVTDGVLEYLHVFNPVETVRDIISCVESGDPEQFAMRILERILLYTGGRIMDDMTVLVISTQER